MWLLSFLHAGITKLDYRLLTHQFKLVRAYTSSPLILA